MIHPILEEVGGSLLLIFVGSRRFELHAIDAIHTVDEQYENEDKCDLYSLTRVDSTVVDGLVVAHLHPIL
jgi:hypothetical protein